MTHYTPHCSQPIYLHGTLAQIGRHEMRSFLFFTGRLSTAVLLPVATRTRSRLSITEDHFGESRTQ